MLLTFVLAACGTGPVVSLEEAAAAKGASVVEVELKSVNGLKVVLGEATEAQLPAKRADLKPGERYRVQLKKKGAALSATTGSSSTAATAKRTPSTVRTPISASSSSFASARRCRKT